MNRAATRLERRPGRSAGPPRLPRARLTLALLAGTLLATPGPPLPARASTREIVKVPRASHDEATDRALDVYHAGDRVRSLAMVDSILAADPDRFAARIVRGHMRLAQGDRGGAEEDFERAVRMEPARPEGHHGLGLVDFDDVRHAQRAVLTLKRLVFLNPESDAIKHFERALEIEPDFHDAALSLAELYLNRGKIDDYRRVIDLLQERLAANYRMNDALYALSVALMGLERLDEAENTLVQLLTREPGHNGGLLRLAELYLVTDRPTQASETYRRLTRGLSDPAIVQEIRLGMEPVLTGAERRAIDGAGDVGAFLRRYWNRRDPTPTTVANERLIEHLRRLVEARRMYASTGPRGFDDRGMIHVRFGEPTDRHISAGRGETRANESWAYHGIADEIVTFDFVDRGGGVFELTRDLSDVLSSFSLDHRDRITALQEVFQERQFLSPTYARAASELMLLRDESSGSLAREVEHATTAVADYRRVAEERQVRAPSAAYEHPSGVDRLDGTMVMARFRGGAEHGRLEVYYGLTTPQLQFNRAPDGRSRAVVEESFALFDREFEEIARARRQRSLVVDDPRSLEQAYVGQLIIPPPGSPDDAYLAPGQYRLAFALRDVSTNRSKEFSVSFPIFAYAPDSLRISDLQLAVDVDPSRPGPGLKPYPYSVVDAERPLYVHYEIYGLRHAADGLTDFRVAYGVERPGGGLLPLIGRLNPFGGSRREGIEIDASRRGLASDEVDVVELDLTGLEGGRYRLTVRIEDRVTGVEVSSAMEIELVRR